MTGQTCALPGCDKPPWPSVRPGDAPALACGNLHHQLLMASRFNLALPYPPHQAILDRNAAGLCALRFCKKAPWSADHCWCSKDHYLLWLKEFTSSLQREQICMLQGCTRHVFVEENGSPSQFCGWRHNQKFVMLGALQRQMPSVDISPQPPASPASLSESEHDRLPSLKSLMLSFKQFVHSGIRPKNIPVMDNFYEKHPWEVITEGHACWLIVHLKYTSKGRKLTTKGHYHWKQSGPRAKRSKYPVKYYTYAKRKGKEKEAYQHHAENSYTMKEYTLEDVKGYALAHLVKEEKASFCGELGKAEPGKHEIAEQVEDACSQDTATSKLLLWDDELSGDSTYRGLTPL